MNATKVNAGPAESNGRLLLGIWRDSLHVTCGLTACTPGSAPGPTLGNEYGRTLPFTFRYGGQMSATVIFGGRVSRKGANAQHALRTDAGRYDLVSIRYRPKV